MKSKKKTKKKVSKYIRIFNKYSRGKEYLTKSNMIRLLKYEFHLNYNNHIMSSCMEIWGTEMNNKKVIMKSTFPLLFKKPDGFLRQFNL